MNDCIHLRLFYGCLILHFFSTPARDRDGLTYPDPAPLNLNQMLQLIQFSFLLPFWECLFASRREQSYGSYSTIYTKISYLATTGQGQGGNSTVGYRHLGACLVSGWCCIHSDVNRPIGYPPWVQTALLAADTSDANCICRIFLCALECQKTECRKILNNSALSILLLMCPHSPPH